MSTALASTNSGLAGVADDPRTRLPPSTSTFTVPSGSFSSCSTLASGADVDRWHRAPGSSSAAFIWVASRICLSVPMTSSSALDRLLAADEERNDHVREHHDVAQWEDCGDSRRWEPWILWPLSNLSCRGHHQANRESHINDRGSFRLPPFVTGVLQHRIRHLGLLVLGGLHTGQRSRVNIVGKSTPSLRLGAPHSKTAPQRAVPQQYGVECHVRQLTLPFLALHRIACRAVEHRPVDDFCRLMTTSSHAVERRAGRTWCRAGSLSMIERRPRAPVLRSMALLGDRARSASSWKVSIDTLHLEQPLVLLQERVLGLASGSRSGRSRRDPRAWPDHRQAADELGNQTVLQQVLRLDDRGTPRRCGDPPAQRRSAPKPIDVFLRTMPR